jgi:hypothetical protein
MAGSDVLNIYFGVVTCTVRISGISVAKFIAVTLHNPAHVTASAMTAANMHSS